MFPPRTGEWFCLRARAAGLQITLHPRSAQTRLLKWDPRSVSRTTRYWETRLLPRPSFPSPPVCSSPGVAFATGQASDDSAQSSPPNFPGLSAHEPRERKLHPSFAAHSTGESGLRRDAERRLALRRWGMHFVPALSVTDPKRRTVSCAYLECMAMRGGGQVLTVEDPVRCACGYDPEIAVSPPRDTLR